MKHPRTERVQAKLADWKLQQSLELTDMRRRGRLAWWGMMREREGGGGGGTRVFLIGAVREIHVFCGWFADNLIENLQTNK